MFSTFPLQRIIVAVLIGAGVWLACVFGGTLLASIGIPVLSTLGELLAGYAVVIGALAGLWYFFTGRTPG